MATIAEMIHHKYSTIQGMKELAIVSAVSHMVAELGKYRARERKKARKARDSFVMSNLKPLVKDTHSSREKLIAAGLLLPSELV